jgi:hypothetical protein
MHHFVLIEPVAGASPEGFERLWEALHELRDRIPGILEITCGQNESPEGLSQGFSHGFTMRFTDTAARDAYLPHPAHIAVIPLVQAVAARVLVFDLPA